MKPLYCQVTQIASCLPRACLLQAKIKADAAHVEPELLATAADHLPLIRMHS